MRGAVAFAFLLMFWTFAGPAAAGALDRIERPPPSWKGPVFEPNFRFPAKAPAEPKPWNKLSFRAQPELYMRALLAYALEGQDLARWRLRTNRVRGWYHMPWLGPGANGREFIHGLTRARDLAPGELGAGQTACRQNWALAFYNADGGAVLGRIWRRAASRGGGPDLSALPFPPGTVAVKLVFSEADAIDDPRLSGAPGIEANIHADPTPGDAQCANALDDEGRPAARRPQRLRLIQLDIAVREERASYKTGWVFASFLYDGSSPGRSAWDRLVPIGLMWGNDPQLSDAASAGGARPKQSIVFRGHGFGRGGRMNGLVDERGSACSSCHMAAQWPSVAPMTAPASWTEAKCWFRNLDARYPFGYEPASADGCSNVSALRKLRALDYSLQLAIGLRNWSLAQARRGGVGTSIGVLELSGEELKVNGEVALPLKR